MKVLVDSSVWIQFLSAKNVKLRGLLRKDQVLTNDLILMEMIPFFHLHRNLSAIDKLDGIAKIPLQIDWEHLQEIRIKNLQNGINNVGIPDLIILQQALQHKIPVCTLDKHFKLMQPIFGFELMEG